MLITFFLLLLLLLLFLHATWRAGNFPVKKIKFDRERVKFVFFRVSLSKRVREREKFSPPSGFNLNSSVNYLICQSRGAHLHGM